MPRSNHSFISFLDYSSLEAHKFLGTSLLRNARIIEDQPSLLALFLMMTTAISQPDRTIVVDRFNYISSIIDGYGLEVA